MQNFRDLKAWQHSYELALSVYRITTTFPKSEIYGLTNQIRRSAISIASNLAEGCGRGTDIDFARFTQIAFGSACELECQLLLAHGLNYMQQPDFDAINEQLSRIKRMLTGLLKTLRSDSRQPIASLRPNLPQPLANSRKPKADS